MAHLPFHIDRLEFFHPLLPAEQDGFCVAFISDMHVAHGGAAEDELARHLGAHEYDIVLFGGDYQSGFGPVSDRTFAVISKVVRAARSRHGVFGCRGNHDSDDVIRRLASEPMTLEENRSFRIADRFHLVVIGDAWTRRDDVERAVRGLSPDDFKLTLTHGPDVAWKASHAGAHVMLCGHTHGGQVRLPFIDSPVKRLRHDRRLVRGEFRLNRMLLHVSEGFGTSLFSIRYGTRRSIAELTLRRGELRRNTAARIFSKEMWGRFTAAAD